MTIQYSSYRQTNLLTRYTQASLAKYSLNVNISLSSITALGCMQNAPSQTFLPLSSFTSPEQTSDPIGGSPAEIGLSEETNVGKWGFAVASATPQAVGKLRHWFVFSSDAALRLYRLLLDTAIGGFPCREPSRRVLPDTDSQHASTSRVRITILHSGFEQPQSVKQANYTSQ